MSNKSQSYFVKQDYENVISNYIINDYKAVSKRSHSTVLQVQSLVIDFYRFLIFVVIIPVVLSDVIFILTHSMRNVITVIIASVIIGLVSLIYTNKPKTINVSITEYNTVEVSGYTIDRHRRRLRHAYEGLSTVLMLSLLVYTALIVRYSIMH